MFFWPQKSIPSVYFAIKRFLVQQKSKYNIFTNFAAPTHVNQSKIVVFVNIIGQDGQCMVYGLEVHSKFLLCNPRLPNATKAQKRNILFAAVAQSRVRV